MCCAIKMFQVSSKGLWKEFNTSLGKIPVISEEERRGYKKRVSRVSTFVLAWEPQEEGARGVSAGKRR